MSEKVPWPRVIFNLAILAIVILGIPVGVVYLIAPSMIPGTSAYVERVAREDAAAQKRAAESEALLIVGKAQLACEKAVSSNSKFPTKAIFDPGWLNIPETGRIKGDPSTIAIRGRVELMNSFGAMIPHRYACDVKDGRVIAISVEPG
jgi:hypothetical protein